MQQPSRLTLNAAAWFFVGQSDDVAAQKNVRIETPFRIGRNDGSDLCLTCQSVSGQHAEIIEEDGELWLRDMNSTNGTFVNGDRIRVKNRLRENDTVQFGTTVFQVSRDESADSFSKTARRPGDTGNGSQEDEFGNLFKGGVVPFFQPILKIDGADQVIAGYEVLGRSRLFGLRTPAQMFAAASRLEMEAELSRFFRSQGIKVADEHLPSHHTLFVNTHPAELKCAGLEESLFEIRDNHPQRPIMLEVHESVLNEARSIEGLHTTLKSLDIQLAIHDFGAGQVRLAELSEICPAVVKFDIKLIQGIDKATSKRQQFVASLVKMVADLGITPLAEYIEQKDEHTTLQQLGFQLGQGFLYGKPSSIADCSGATLHIRSDAPPAQVPQVKSFLATEQNREPADASSGSSFSRNTAQSSDTPRNDDWLLQQPEHHYTIQVLSAISQERALEHIAAQDNPSQFAVFCKRGKTRMLYIVVCGVFEDRAAAKQASISLTNSSVSPWIRMLASVHAEIRSGNS